MKYCNTVQSKLSFSETVSSIREELLKEEFGIISEIDVKSTFKNKLAIEYDNYLILGACNPNFAHDILEFDKNIGVLLPCNIIIYEKESRVIVSAVKPSDMMGNLDNNVSRIALEVESRLKKVISKVQSC